MQRPNYINALENIDHHLGGEGFRLNVYLKGGRAFYDYAVADLRHDHPAASSEIVRLDKDDHPPVYVEIERIDAIELVS